MPHSRDVCSAVSITVCISLSEKEQFDPANCERSRASSWSRAYSHSHVRNFLQSEILITFDFLGIGYGTISVFFYILIDIRDETAMTLLVSLFLYILEDTDLSFQQNKKFGF